MAGRPARRAGKLRRVQHDGTVPDEECPLDRRRAQRLPLDQVGGGYQPAGARGAQLTADLLAGPTWLAAPRCC